MNTTYTFDGYKLSPNGTTRRAIYLGPEEAVTENQLDFSSISSLSSVSSFLVEQDVVQGIDLKPCLGDTVKLTWDKDVKWKHPRAKDHCDYRDGKEYNGKIVGISLKNGELMYECQWQEGPWNDEVHNVIAPESHISTSVANEE